MALTFLNTPAPRRPRRLVIPPIIHLCLTPLPVASRSSPWVGPVLSSNLSPLTLPPILAPHPLRVYSLLLILPSLLFRSTSTGLSLFRPLLNPRPFSATSYGTASHISSRTRVFVLAFPRLSSSGGPRQSSYSLLGYSMDYRPDGNTARRPPRSGRRLPRRPLRRHSVAVISIHPGPSRSRP